jgi:hypothetical protein
MTLISWLFLVSAIAAGVTIGLGITILGDVIGRWYRTWRIVRAERRYRTTNEMLADQVSKRRGKR